jgi:hypothetical protein
MALRPVPLASSLSRQGRICRSLGEGKLSSSPSRDEVSPGVNFFGTLSKIPTNLEKVNNIRQVRHSFRFLSSRYAEYFGTGET